MAGRESAEDKIGRLIAEALDARERKANEAKDPRARFDSLMSRFEALLDSMESKGDAGEGRRSRRRGAADDEGEEGGGGIISELFG